MKEKWQMLVASVQKLIDDDASVISGLRNGPDIAKIRKNFERNVKILGEQIDEFSMFVPDPDREEIDLPFGSKEFSDSWSDYKEFLFSVFGIILVPIEERRRLKKLYNISRKDECRALEFLDFYICCRYKSIFLPKDFQLNNDEPGDESTQETAFTLKRTTI